MTCQISLGTIDNAPGSGQPYCTPIVNLYSGEAERTSANMINRAGKCYHDSKSGQYWLRYIRGALHSLSSSVSSALTKASTFWGSCLIMPHFKT